MKRKSKKADTVKVHGMFRLNLLENGKIVGDSGWRSNVITDLGFDQYICQTLLGMAGSKKITYMGIGTGTAPTSAQTSLDGELASRVTIATNTVASHTAQCAASFSSSVFSSQGPKTIDNIGLWNTASGGTMFAGSTFASSQWNTNQDLVATYQIRFS